MNAIDKKLKVELGGFPQKIHILSNDDTKPVLLFLHGGPGVVNRHSVVKDHIDLLDTFTLVAWDQRGSGGSYKGINPETLTLKRMTDDAAELTSWLCDYFKKDKIFILGGSWGSVLGTFLVYRYPEQVAAYVGFGQVVDGTKNEELSYDFALAAATEANDTESVEILKSVGPPVKGVYVGGLSGLMKQRKVMMKYGGYSPDAKKDSLFKSQVLPMLKSGEYSISGIWGILKGYRLV
ncbi:MAG: alpha/beta hydrolase, partial [Oscillospiraceae bacterium]|nr:alpha/beta hydrolase [Oscillospiraceae bacterium]